MDMEELNTSLSENEGRIATLLNRSKRWFLSQAQYLNFFTILLLASVSQIILVPKLIVQPLFYYIFREKTKYFNYLQSSCSLYAQFFSSTSI